MNIVINIPNEVEIALNILHRNGYEAYVVGGCVRDSIMDKFPQDWDITSSAKPEEIKLCFNDYKTVDTGIKHGTVTVIIEGMPIEITSYRIDGEYKDNRRPDNVLFTAKLELDLERRDFTINALAYNKNGIIDLFGGINDINNKIIRCVGNPDERFNEDGLRILRALRFASVLNFNIEKQTSDSIHKTKYLLNNISLERINIEFNKLILGSDFQRLVIEYRNVIEVFIPELSKFNQEELNYRLNSMKHVESLVLRLSLLLYKIEEVENILIRLKYDNFTVKSVKLLTSCIDERIYPDPVNIKKWLNKIEYENLDNLLKVKKALFESQHEDLSKAQRIMNEVIEENQCYSLKTLAVDGQDLIDLGIEKGKNIGIILNKLLNKVIEGKLENKKDMLISYINKNFKI